MKLTTGIRREMAGLVLDALPPTPTTVTGLVDALGGSREAARALGLKMGTQAQIQHSQRDIQRYMNFEKYGKTPSNRRPSPEVVQKLYDAVAKAERENRYKEIKKAGIYVQMEEVEVIDPSGVPDGTRNVDIVLRGDALDRFLAAYDASLFGALELEETADVFDEVVMQEYGFLGAHIDAGGNAIAPQNFSLSLAR